MKIKHIWSVLCEKSIINQDDNIISLIGILEELNATITPVNKNFQKKEKIIIPFNFEVVNYWTKQHSEEVKMQVKVAVVDPDGKEISDSVNESIFPKDVKRLRTRLRVQGLPVTRSGNYHFKISLRADNDKVFTLISELPLEVRVKVEEPKDVSKN